MIEEFASSEYERLDSTHGLNHAERTVKIADYLSRREGANILICRLGALLHQFHPEKAHEVDRFLNSIGIDDSLREEIVHCVETSEIDTIDSARTLEAKVVFDADKLQTIGPFGLIREVCYRTSTKGIDFRAAVEDAKNLQDVMLKHLQTETARNLITTLTESVQDFITQFEKWDKMDFLDSM